MHKLIKVDIWDMFKYESWKLAQKIQIAQPHNKKQKTKLLLIIEYWGHPRSGGKQCHVYGWRCWWYKHEVWWLPTLWEEQIYPSLSHTCTYYEKWSQHDFLTYTYTHNSTQTKFPPRPTHPVTFNPSNVPLTAALELSLPPFRSWTINSQMTL